MDEAIIGMLNHKISETRSTVIDHAVKIEFLINGILSRVLGITPGPSISFGNTSSALSFMAKVNLLIDLRILNKGDKEKLQIFAEIRNKFAHDFMIMELNSCPKSILNSLRKWYLPNTAVDSIADFRPLYLLLYEDAKKGIESLLNTVKETAMKKGADLANLDYNMILFNEVERYSEIDMDFKTKFIALINSAASVYDKNPPSDEKLDSLPLI